MTDFLAAIYPWTKSLHIMAVLSWMAGLFYLPRIFVYHVERAGTGTETDEIFRVMEWKLLRYIMTPSMIATWLFGLMLVMTPGIVDWTSAWPWVKAAGVVAMTWFHFWLAGCRRDFAAGNNARSGRSYRIWNEFPTLAMIVIVIAVVVKF